MFNEFNKLASVTHLLEEHFCVLIVDVKGVITYVNQAFCKLSQYSANELIGKKHDLINSTFSTSSLRDQDKKIFKEKIQRHKKDGTSYWVHSTSMHFLDDNEEIAGFIFFEIDITKYERTEKKYIEALENLQNIENALNQSTVVAITDHHGIISYVNDEFCHLSKYSPEELIGQTHRIINSSYHPKSFFNDMWETISKGRIWRGDIQNQSKDGSLYWVSTTIVPISGKNNKPHRYISIRVDITDKKEAEHALEMALKNDFRQTVKHLQNAIFKYALDENNKLIFTLLEGQIAQKLNFTIDTFNNREFKNLFPTKEINYIRKHFRNALQGESGQFEMNYDTFTLLVYLSPIFENNKVVEVVGTATDISERITAERIIEHMAYYDYVTELPNRRLFQRKTEEYILECQDRNSKFAIMFIDLDRFKNVNDSMGHSVGDQLLQKVGVRLKSIIRKGDFIARYGGDEYILLLPISNEKEIKTLATKIVDSFREPFFLNSFEIIINASIGVSIFPKNATNYEALISYADSAMYYAKEIGKNNSQFFTEKLQDEILERATLELELRKALENQQLTLHYQPQIDIKKGNVCGVEALIRWQHPEIGSIPPARFIPVAEVTGLIIPIGQWVLEKACAQVKKWHDNGLPLIAISVNVSIQQFKQTTFVGQVTSILSKTGLSPTYLNLEITESMTSDVKECLLTLNALRSAGIHVSIDDFGTGYSSLSYLSKFPVTHLKIDRAFVNELTSSNRAIVKTIITLAHNLNLRVIAEGVETREQANFLRKLNCDEVQGFFYSKPLPKEEIETLLLKKLS